MIKEAVQAGVVKEIVNKKATNPNKWAKHMAPWYDMECRNARNNYRRAQ